MKKQPHLIVVTETAISIEDALRMKEGLEQRIGIPVTVLGNVRQVMLIESGSD